MGIRRVNLNSDPINSGPEVPKENAFIISSLDVQSYVFSLCPDTGAVSRQGSHLESDLGKLF